MALIREVLARLRRHDVHAGGKRVLRLMRRDGLLAPQRAPAAGPRGVHDGPIVPAAPNLRWCTDSTMPWTAEDGWDLRELPVGD